LAGPKNQTIIFPYLEQVFVKNNIDQTFLSFFFLFIHKQQKKISLKKITHNKKKKINKFTNQAKNNFSSN
jgi:hypothetical protein